LKLQSLQYIAGLQTFSVVFGESTVDYVSLASRPSCHLRKANGFLPALTDDEYIVTASSHRSNILEET